MEDVNKHKFCDDDPDYGNKTKPYDDGQDCAKKCGVEAGEQGDAKKNKLAAGGEVDGKKNHREQDTGKQREPGGKKREHDDSEDFYPISM